MRRIRGCFALLHTLDDQFGSDANDSAKSDIASSSKPLKAPERPSCMLVDFSKQS